MRQPHLFSEQNGHIGTDESGKGDYFGPLVVAGVFVPDDQKDALLELGVKDSKRVTDKRAQKLSEIIKEGYKHSLVVIGPEKYNELYEKFKNLNKLLAWAHSRAIENLLEEVSCSLVITDQFGDERFVTNALMTKGKNVELIQMHRAEEDMAVAAASILARAEFLRRMSLLSQEFGVEIPRGSSPRSEEMGIELVKTHGPEILKKTAKIHFKLTQRIFDALG
ncbi:MAG: ribonuclease HIII [Candidatus Aminicenantes bacterium]|jgi:ribonuclease HIII|nr:ribonuclease HIII [Candidatus Aminicenantes bacterium]